MGCWSNNSANCHPSPGAFNRKVLLSCLVPQCSYPPHRPSGAASLEILGETKMFDFRRITLFCLEKRFSKHKMTIFSKHLGGAWPLCPTPATPMHRPRHQPRLPNCDWMPASYTSGQTSNPCRHPTCWPSSQWSHTVSSAPCHAAWTSAPLSAHPSIECKRTAPQIETPICTRRTTTHLISLSDNNSIRAAQWADQQWNAE